MGIMKLSDQAIAAFVMILQKGLVEMADVTELFRELEFVFDEDELMCINVPTLKVDFSNLGLSEDDADI